MKSYKEWKENTDLSSWEPGKPWKATKKEIVSYWNSLPPGIPIVMRSIPATHKGSTYQEDGIRITGSPNFITSILSRIKDLISYESQDKRLNVVYRQQINNKTNLPVPGSFVFYLQLKEREGS